MHSNEDILCNFVLHHTTNKTSASQYGLAVLYWGLHTVEPLGVPGSPSVSEGECRGARLGGWVGQHSLVVRDLHFCLEKYVLWNVNTVELRGPGNQWECQLLVHVPHKLFQTGCHNQLGKAFFKNSMHVSTGFAG